ncbi:tRNA (adenosine(37)-N6)-threonylcarbamoyltransferase complex dimerization subunit type 1 TsaB [Anaerovorax odorimutans]|uniref:tRNA (Adenosine(37)-N6)-threonylcarbamoyltransferase complex dimerization subunit type 1 TsaB n=1 Tax=Anaerovorax odorimutans TaxID=109327 RepID=A0ABT1RLS5_9FIRM|nr:tRNA (adenosine(37)-N6)-threonylcarbamoyltransferase complex dimerization subunit type 1 TsaB [Anaerovorax odorimutans]MCQ4636138.1 tRNA (adenosine(37)-N6)-threonylcarbamoyltransferase complex dimerization subunit type 1 TsaB [Anaerovorax odorimutans]
MYILALETTGAHASVAIIDEEERIFLKKSDGVLNHLQHLMPMTQELLAENNLRLSDITAVAASQGPGSFTGIRIGVSSARALAQVLDVKAIAVPTLKAFAYQAPDYKGLICPVFDARRNQVYAGAYRWENGAIQEVVTGAPYLIEEFLEKVDAAGDQRMFFGDGTKAYADYFQEAQLAPEEIRLQSAASVARLAKDLFSQGKAVSYEELKPNYMRKAEAERKLEEKKNE